MVVEISQNTPLADALSAAIPPKLTELGLATGGADDAALAEYIVLMLVNGKSLNEIATELAGDLLGLEADNPVAHEFARWLFEQIEIFNSQASDAQPAASEPTADALLDDGLMGEMDTDMGTTDLAAEVKAPTGPKSMRNGSARGGGGGTGGARDKRMLGQMSKAMDRTGENVLHHVRGNGSARINTHGRGAPTGPRTTQGRVPRNNNNRAANIQYGLAGMEPSGPQAPGWMMQGQQPNQMDLVAMLEQQNQMMFQLSQQLMNGQGTQGNQGNQGNQGQQRRGKSLFDRTQNPNQKPENRRGHHNGNVNKDENQTVEGGENAQDVDMAGENSNKQPPNPDDTVCKYNLSCTNKDCKFAHQSPAAPHGSSVDVNDVCSFGAACKNRKCVGRHPSPAQRFAHQSEQDCKFYPNCQNPRCPFKHPSMPLCRNGGECTTENCKFTHVKTKCKFTPCLNPACAFVHDPGQRGGYKDKVWTADSASDTMVSDRKFVNEQGDEEFVKPEDGSGKMHEEMATQDHDIIA